jgi:hypothetical protein
MELNSIELELKDRLTDCINEILLLQIPTVMYLDIDSTYFE